MNFFRLLEKTKNKWKRGRGWPTFRTFKNLTNLVALLTLPYFRTLIKCGTSWTVSLSEAIQYTIGLAIPAYIRKKSWVHQKIICAISWTMYLTEAEPWAICSAKPIFICVFKKGPFPASAFIYFRLFNTVDSKRSI